MTDLHNSVVLITGANGGLGAEFVRQALERGAARVYATARSPREWGDERVVPLALDVTDVASVAAAAAAASDTTVVVNNAGAGYAAPLSTASLDDVRALFETNVFGPLAVAQAFAPVLAANGGGALVDIHSALSWHAGGNAYSASKAALWSITNSLRLELAGRGTQVVGAHLGYTDTPMTAGLDVPKERPEVIVAAIYDGLESGAHEVLADATSVYVKSALSGELVALYPELAAS
ncbi:SDR family oxidoreductase [Agromyces sp. ISL-38]|uniref:SDR family oxidoreductase n=1 Tax=Agromyces sp. ISL-38 TaxID=2819107 RepID=UPI001BED0D00|nr:SDR family oxidoreductase [Agromyces sp. ISL-38]MBT2499175.1 SDR family oxidoreductase [Agromyces sp. ISL-38]MBT2518280.1 SDR family oxidoreductase [Streptomyces sp. ISL-90]